MDITGTNGPNKGKTFLVIYELKGDELRVCYDLSGESASHGVRNQGEHKAIPRNLPSADEALSVSPQ